eukprot:3346222-Rhodomonas_salina.1
MQDACRFLRVGCYNGSYADTRYAPMRRSIQSVRIADTHQLVHQDISLRESPYNPTYAYLPTQTYVYLRSFPGTESISLYQGRVRFRALKEAGAIEDEVRYKISAVCTASVTAQTRIVLLLFSYKDRSCLYCPCYKEALLPIQMSVLFVRRRLLLILNTGVQEERRRRLEELSGQLTYAPTGSRRHVRISCYGMRGTEIGHTGTRDRDSGTGLAYAATGCAVLRSVLVLRGVEMQRQNALEELRVRLLPYPIPVLHTVWPYPIP